MSDYFIFRGDVGDHAPLVKAPGLTRDAAVKLVCGEPSVSELRYVDVVLRGERADVMSGTPAGTVWASRRFRDEIEGASMTGLKFIEARDVVTKEALELFLLQVEGRAGYVDDRLNPTFSDYNEGSGVGFRGYCFDVSTWDGSDFFSPLNYFGIFCTKRVVELLVQSALTGWAVLPIDSVERFGSGLFPPTGLTERSA